MRVVFEIWKLLDRRQRRSFLLLQAAALLMAVSTLIGVAAIVPFFAVLADPGRISHSAVLTWVYRTGGFSTGHSFLIGVGFGSVGIILLADAINWLGSVAMNRFAAGIGDHFGTVLFEHYLHRDYPFHLSVNSANLLNNVIWEVGRGTKSVLQFYFILCTNLAAGVLIIASILLVNPLLAMTTLVALTLTYTAIYGLVRRRLLRNGQLETRYSRERTQIASESLRGFREISLSRGQAFFRDEFQRSCESLSRVGLSTQAIAQAPRFVLECVVVAGLVGTALFLVGRGGETGPWLAQLTYLGFAAYRLLPALQQVFHSLVRIRSDRVAFHHVADDLRRACAPQERTPLNVNTSSWRGRPFSHIQLAAVTFQYAGDRPPAIRDVTLRIDAGTTVGLVGASGSGKTTLSELILGLLVPTSGTLAVDGIVLDATNRGDWQSTVAYVPQGIVVFDASLAQNIAVGVGREHLDEQRLRHAVRLAQLEPLVATFPNGYQEQLGEHGARLSGGQRQRLGIARALYRQASVLILDEATSALDRLTEDEIMSTLDALRGERTIILIAHRLSTVLRCDAIFELANGAVIGARIQDEFMQGGNGSLLTLQHVR
jgi:ABC-type multidrug transport system fused ATPase/permease subunit